jgi:glutathione S-transferase
MTLTFYYVPNSTSNVTSAVLAELEYSLGAPLCARVQLSIQAGDTKAPVFLATVNPNGRVPAIVHDGVPIWESAAITMYLGEMFGVDDQPNQTRSTEPLYPALGPQRGEAMKWIVWANLTIADAGARLTATLQAGSEGGVEEGSADLVAEEEKGNDAVKRALGMEVAKKDLARWLRVLDGGLEGRAYLLGERYSLVDTHVWSFVRWLTFMEVDLEPYGNVGEWVKRVGLRPALKKEIGGG